MVEYQDFEIRDFSGGLIDYVDDNLLPENASGDMQNWISRTIGSLKKRPGQKRLNSSALGGAITGLYPFYHGTSRKLIAAANGIVSYWTGSSFNNIKTGLNTSANIMFETCVNYLVSFNGINTPWKYDGSAVTTLANAPSDGQFCVFHKGQLFTVPTSNPSSLRWSGLWDIEAWAPADIANIKSGDGDKITNLKKHIGELIIFKGRSLHALRGNNAEDFRLDEMDSRVGCVGPNAAAVVGPYVYFIADDGIYVWNGVRAQNISEERIPKLWATLNKQYLNKAAVGYWDGLVWFAVPEGTSAYNNLVIAYDPSSTSATGGSFWVWRGINASCFTTYNDGTKNIFYSGDSISGYINTQATGTDDFGAAIKAYWEGKHFDVGSPERKKKSKKLFVQDSPDTENTVNIQTAKDYGTYKDCSLRATDGTIREFKFADSDRWRFISPKISHNAKGECEVRGILIPYKAKSKPKVS